MSDGSGARDWAKESQALADELKKAYADQDQRYFKRIIDLFYVVVEAAQAQGVTKDALKVLVDYNYQRERVLSEKSIELRKLRATRSDLH